MNVVLTALAEACINNQFAEKKLIVNSYREGHQLLEAAARGGQAWLNVTPSTPLGLAEELAGPAFIGESIRIIDDGEILFLVGETLAEMKSGGELKYFAELEGLFGPEGILKGALLELRMAGVKADEIDPDSFVSRQKGEEIKQLLAGYEIKLKDRKLADRASVYMKAFDILQSNTCPDDSLYLVPEQLEFDYLTFKFLKQLIDNKGLVLPAEKVCGLSRQESYFFEAAAEPDVQTPLSRLYAQEGVVDGAADPELDFFQAYSPACEIREVFRRIKKDGVKADQVLICYTNGDTYLPLIYSAAETYGVPVSYAEGLPVTFTRPGQLLAGLLSWIDDNYSAGHIYRLLNSNSISVSSASALALLLRRAAVGWGKDRYQPCLQALEVELNAKLKLAEDKGYDTDYQYKRLERLAGLKQLIMDLLSYVPEVNSDGAVQFDRLCEGLAAIMTEYAPTSVENERLARESILEMLEQAAISFPHQVDYPTAVKRLKARLNSIRVGAAAPAAGYLHAASPGKAESTDRSLSFLVGLAGGYFPGSGLQDAVLLDREREAISRNLSLASISPERNLYKLGRLLASRRGRVVLSYSSFEPVEGRPAFPASILLQVYRLGSGKLEADYSDFFNSLGPPAAYYPSGSNQALAVSEWWLSEVIDGSRSGDLDSVKDCYPGIKAGLEAEAARRSNLFTEYDGKVTVDPALVDPRTNRNRSLSASALEKLAGCPYAYFLRYMLAIKLPDEQSFDRWAWLDAMERGSLLHNIYARYLREVCSTAGGPREDKVLLSKITEEEIDDKKKQTPPPSDLVFESEKNELLRELEVFLKCEAQLWKEGSIPLYMEAPFGRGPVAVQEAGVGQADPLELNLPGGDKVFIRGSIDRIDRLPGQSSYRVWDYKTGSTYAYKQGGYIRQGRQIQNVLYAEAAEKILQPQDPKAEVREAGYLFPTEKGEGQRVLRNQGKRQEALQAVELMIDLLAEGTFCMATDDDPPCKFCEYQAVCRHPQCLEDTALKRANTANSNLGPWKELQEYE